MSPRLQALSPRTIVWRVVRQDNGLWVPLRIITRALPVMYRWARGGSAYKQKDANLTVNSVNYGNIAEYHADTGFDDYRLVQDLQGGSGLRVIHHDRHIMPSERLRTIGLRLLGIPTNFKLLLQKA